jgi:hypothetical protein
MVLRRVAAFPAAEQKRRKITAKLGRETNLDSKELAA